MSSSSSSQESMTMQPLRSNYSSRKLSAGDTVKQPQGARPKSRKGVKIDDNTTPLKQNTSPLRQTRALPDVPPTTTHSHVSRPSQSARGIRPLPRCPPPFSSQPSSSTSTHFAAPTIGIPPAGVDALSVDFSIPDILPLTPDSPSPPPTPPKDLVRDQFEPHIYDDSSSEMELIQFTHKRRHDSDCTSEDNEHADIIMGPLHYHQKNKEVAGYCWVANRANARQPIHNPPAIKKWVTEKKGHRVTVENYDHVLHMLRTL